MNHFGLIGSPDSNGNGNCHDYLYVFISHFSFRDKFRLSYPSWLQLITRIEFIILSSIIGSMFIFYCLYPNLTLYFIMGSTATVILNGALD